MTQLTLGILFIGFTAVGFICGVGVCLGYGVYRDVKEFRRWHNEGGE